MVACGEHGIGCGAGIVTRRLEREGSTGLQQHRAIVWVNGDGSGVAQRDSALTAERDEMLGTCMAPLEVVAHRPVQKHCRSQADISEHRKNEALIFARRNSKLDTGGMGMSKRPRLVGGKL